MVKNFFVGEKSVRGSLNLPIQTVTLVPSTRSLSQPISDAEFRRRIGEVKRKLSGFFGGYTSWHAQGGYVLRNKLVGERVAFVTSYGRRNAYRKNKLKWINWVKAKGRVWGQDSMGVIIENDMLYIPTR